jgi:hypothetical protein
VTKLLQFKMTEESYAHHPRTAEFEGAVVLITGAASGTDSSLSSFGQDVSNLLTTTCQASGRLVHDYSPSMAARSSSLWTCLGPSWIRLQP